MLFPTLFTLFLSVVPGHPEKVDVLINEFSQPNQYQLDIRLDKSRSQEITNCIAELTGLSLTEPVTENVVAEAEGMNLTYLPKFNHLALIATDYTPSSADRARAAGQELKGCLELSTLQGTR